MPKTMFPINLKKPMAEQELVGHNRWHPDIPSAVAVNPGDVVPDRMQGLDRRPDQEQRQPERRPRRRPVRRARLERSDRSQRGQARRHPGRRHPRHRLPAGRRVGVHRHLRPQQRRRLPYRPLSRRGQGHLGLKRHLRHVAAHPGRAVCRLDPSRLDRLRPVARAAGQVEQARSPSWSPRIPSACRRWPTCRMRRTPCWAPSKGPRSTASPKRPPAPFRRGNTAATATSRTCRAVREFTSRSTSTAPSSRWATFTSRRGMGKSRSAGPSKCPASSTCTSTSSREASPSTAW